MIDFSAIKACTACGLRETCKQVVVSSGPIPSLVMIVGEAPGYHEDMNDRPFVGKAGEFLNAALEEVHLPRETVYVTNTVLCRPPENRDPTAQEIATCSRHLLAQIKEVRPKIIITLGNVPLNFFLSPDDEKRTITARRGRFFQWTHPETKEKFIVLPTFHPSYILRNESALPNFLLDLHAARWFLTGDSKRLPQGEGTRTRKPAPPHSFIAGWHIGDHIHLIYRDEHGNRRLHSIPGEESPWYFWIFEPDLTPYTRRELGIILQRGVPYRGELLTIRAMTRDPESKGWIRVYPNVPPSWVSREVKACYGPETEKLYTTVSPLLHLARAFMICGIRTFEADLDPVRRYMTDHVVTIGTPRRCWFDTETDDESMPDASIQEVIGKVPILMIGCENDDGEKWKYVNEDGTATGERVMLEKFFSETMPLYDMLCAWNGDGFDFPVMRERCRFHEMKIPWHEWILWDQMVSFKKHHVWDAEGKSGYSLMNVGKTLLGEGKIERSKSIMEMFRTERDNLIAYNARDVNLMPRIEAKTHYVEIDAAMSAIGNCFANNPYVSFRVDGLALIEGYRRGVHFKSKEIPSEMEDQFIGAYVQEPVLGVFEGVANLDFASLYPSVFTSWNISPDTYIPPDEVGGVPPENVVTCPVLTIDGEKHGGTKFLRDQVGILPTIYRRIKAERDRCKKEMAKCEQDSPEWMQAKRHEYAYKQLGLSIYGCMGSVYSRFFNRDVAEAVTLSSQYLIRTTLTLATRLGMRPLYSDTDSCFIQVEQENVQRFLDASRVLYARIAARDRCPVNVIELEYEQYFRRIAFLKKKRYAGWLTLYKGRPSDMIEVKGLEMRRSDGIALTRRAQSQLITGVLKEGWNAQKCQDFVLHLREQIFAQKISIEDISVVSSLTKSPHRYNSRLPHVEIAKRMMEAGEEVYIGSKIAYVVLDGRKSPLIATTVDDYRERGLEYDGHYYWTNKTWKALKRVLEVLWAKEDWSAFDVRRERKKREPKPVSDGRVVRRRKTRSIG